MRHTNSFSIIATAAAAAALVAPTSRTHERIAKAPLTTARVAPTPRTRLAATPAKTSVVRYARSYDFQSGDVPVGAAARRAVEFFAAWNKRDMEAACACFSDDCVYEDTQYSGAFEGKGKLREHLDRVADALPDTFAFVVDDIADGGDTVGVRWHVENDGEPLPFTRGASIYKSNENGLLCSGFDVPEPAPIKPGGSGLALLSLASKIIDEPIRAAPLLCALVYCWKLCGNQPVRRAHPIILH